MPSQPVRLYQGENKEGQNTQTVQIIFQLDNTHIFTHTHLALTFKQPTNITDGDETG